MTSAGCRSAARPLRAWWIVPLLTLAVGATERARPVEAAQSEDPRPETAHPEAHEALVERWERLTASEQERLRERYQRFQELDASRRELLLRGGRRLDGLADRIYQNLPDEDRRQLERLSAEERRVQLREMAAEEARELGRIVLEQLPQAWRERFEAASLEDRLRFLESFRRRQDEVLGEVLSELGHSMGFAPEELHRLRALPPEVGRRRLLELLQTHAARKVEELGLPRGVPPSAWSRMARMEAPDFFHAAQRLRAAHPELWPRIGPAAVASEAEREQIRARMRLRAAHRFWPQDHIELLELAPEERAAAKNRLRRGRILDVLREERLLAPEDLARLADEPDPAFFRRVRIGFLTPEASHWRQADGEPAAGEGGSGEASEDR